MNSRWIILGLIVAIIVLGVGAFLLLNNKTSQPKISDDTQTQNNVSPTQAPTEVMEVMKAETVEITLTSDGFSPKSVTIDKGTKVVWTNESGQTATVNSDPHPTHTAYPPLNLGSFSDGEGIELVFNEAGTFGYHNHFDATVRGTIIVK